ncbi:MAG: KR domain-containing protein [Kofleriaceae bacterium]
MTQHGARHVVLASRRGGAGAGVAEQVQELEALGAETVEVWACDVGDRAALGSRLAGLKRRLTGVVHAAGETDDGVIGALTAERVAGVLRSKAEAAWHLHELTAGEEPEMFVMYSSAAGVLGTPGQGSYAAANAFLDAVAEVRRREGQAGLSLAWGLWEEGSGITGALGERDRRASRGPG